MDPRAVELVRSTVEELRAVLERDRAAPCASFEEELVRLELLQQAGDRLLQALRRQALHLRARR